MNIIYEFTNLKTDVAPSLDGNEMVVTRVHYTYRAKDTDSNVFADYESFHNFELSSGSNFTPFTMLTEDIVKTWLETEVDTQVLQPALANSVEDQLTSKYVRIKAPWEAPDVLNEQPI